MNRERYAHPQHVGKAITSMYSSPSLYLANNDVLERWAQGEEDHLARSLIEQQVLLVCKFFFRALRSFRQASS